MAALTGIGQLSSSANESKNSTGGSLGPLSSLPNTGKFSDPYYNPITVDPSHTAANAKATFIKEKTRHVADVVSAKAFVKNGKNSTGSVTLAGVKQWQADVAAGTKKGYYLSPTLERDTQT